MFLLNYPWVKWSVSADERIKTHLLGGGEAGEDYVASPCHDFKEMTANWTLIRDLLGGTVAMRNAGVIWLPQEEKETAIEYSNRVNRSVLYDGLGDTIRKIVEKPFAKEITFLESEGLPEELKAWEDDCDRQGVCGKSITKFARDVFSDGITYGFSHILVNAPAPKKNAGGQAVGYSVAEAKEKRIRPYLEHVKALELFYWHHEQDETGQRKLTEIRFVKLEDEKAGEFGQKKVLYIHRWTETKWEIYKFKKNVEDLVSSVSQQDFDLYDSGTNELGKIPLVTFYAEEDGFMRAKSPLCGLAWKNLAHWQSSSDQTNVLHFARLVTLVLTGLSDEDMKVPTVLGGNRALKFMSEEVEAFFVEHSGKGAEAGEKDLAKIEQQMETLGMQPFLHRSGGSTASARILDEAKQVGGIYSWVRNLRDTLYDAYKLGAERLKKTLPPKFEVIVYTDFVLSTSSSLDSQILDLANTKGVVPNTVYFKELQRRNVVAENYDPEASVAQGQKEMMDKAKATAALAPKQEPEKSEETDEEDEEKK